MAINHFCDFLWFQLMVRNAVMLEETKDTITVPAAFMIRMLACIHSLRNRQGGNGNNNGENDNRSRSNSNNNVNDSGNESASSNNSDQISDAQNRSSAVNPHRSVDEDDDDDD